MAMVLKRYVLAWLLVLASFAVVFALWSRMPEMVPVHWNAHGKVNGWMAKPWGPLIGPLTALATVGFLSICPLISPKQFSMERFVRAWTTIVTGLAGFMFVVTAAVTLAGAGVAVDVTRILGLAVGVLFMMIGNFMGKLTPNFFAGIRTPWTLANEEVWLRTHRLGGKLFFLAGLAAAVTSLVSSVASVSVILGGSLLASIVPTVYSYLLYRKLVASAG